MKQSSKAGVIVLLLISIAVTGLFYQYLLTSRAQREADAKKIKIAPQPQPGTAKPQPEPEPLPPHPKPTPEIVHSEDPEPDTQPDPNRDPDPVVAPKPEPEQDTEPTFDVADFLNSRARKIMRERCVPIIAAKDVELGRNLIAYERELMNEARKEGRTALRDAYTSFIKTHAEECRKDGNTIPDDLPEVFVALAGAAEIHAEFLLKQTAITEKMTREISSLADTYILGLEKQIERLREQNDTGAIKLLEEEIDLVRENQEYFPGLMLQD